MNIKSSEKQVIITLKNLATIKGAIWKIKHNSKAVYRADQLLGDYSSIYFQRRDTGEPYTEEELGENSSINKFMNNHTSTKHARERTFNYFFNKENEEKGQLLRKEIFNRWKTIASQSQLDIKGSTNFLDDSLFSSNIEGTIIEHIKEFLEKYREATKDEDIAEYLTVLTIIAITYEYAKNLPSWILPDTDCSISLNNKDAEIQNIISVAEEALENEDFESVIKLLENCEEMQVDSSSQFFDTDEHLSQTNAYIFLLLSHAYRGMWKNAKTHKEKVEFANLCRENLEDSIAYNNVTALMEAIEESMSESAKAILDSEEVILPYDIQQCAKYCHILIEKHPLATKELGKTYWILYQLCMEYGYQPPEDENKDFYFKKALEYNHPAAIRAHKIESKISILGGLVQSSDDSYGEYYSNDENKIAGIIKQTAPTTWKSKKYTTNIYGHINDAWIRSSKKQKHFLISDDDNKNLNDLLVLLQQIKSSTNFTDPFNRLEFYIRGDEEQLAPLIDTALSRMGDLVFPVHIIDEPKRSAGKVLAQHPLLYPIRTKVQKATQEEIPLSFIIIGENRRCEWLLREAFWMMTFNKANVHSEIVVLAPNAENLVNRITTICSGMKPACLPVTKRTTELSKTFPMITAINCDYNSDEMMHQIKERFNNNPKQPFNSHCYFSIDMGSDLENMSLSINVRETSIKSWGEREINQITANPQMPVITFHCENPDIANLAYHTVVLNEDYGSRWFNNYAIIPFGRMDQEYSWDNLCNDLIDELSLNIHLQYDMGATYNLSNSEDMNRYKNALKSFYCRTYNRDSSRGVALSLPYRLFQGIGKKVHSNENKYILTPLLPPEPIDILDDDAFYSEAAIKYFVDSLEKDKTWMDKENYTRTILLATKDFKKPGAKTETAGYEQVEYIEDAPLYQLANWEHNRWNKWMISRKWTPIKNRKVVETYYYEGNHRQQLYIGRLHPLIATFREVEEFSSDWKKIAKKQKDFCANDISAMFTTANILARQWTKDAKQYFQSKETTQNKQDEMDDFEIE